MMQRKLLWTAAAVLVMVVAAGTFWGAYWADVRHTMARQKSALVTLRELRQFALEDYLQTLRSELILYSDSQPVRDAARRLAAAWQHSGSEPVPDLRGLYLGDNPYPRKERFRLGSAGDGSRYSEVHAEVHPWALRLQEHHGYYDVFLADVRGMLVYSVVKEDDFGTDLVHGPWRDTGLGQVVNAALDATAPDKVFFSDFESYVPSGGEPASFIASPIFDGGGVRLGVLALQVPTDRITAILQFTPGMGRTGETYLVGANYLMRTDSRFAESSTILRTRVETEAARRALGGESSVSLLEDYRDVPVLSAFGQVRFEGTTWAILAEIDEAEIRQHAFRPRRLIGVTLILLGVLGTLGALVMMFVLIRDARPKPWADGE
jgi:methyl-accepting chemotaxis protein